MSDLADQTATQRRALSAGRMLFAIDPGQHTGIAAVYDGHLWACGLLDGRKPESVRTFVRNHADAVSMIFGLAGWSGRPRVVWEMPQIYPAKSGLGGTHQRPQDLLTLAVTGARVCQSAIDELDCPCGGGVNDGAPTILEMVEPHQWKASVPKDIMTRRIESFVATPGVGREKDALERGLKNVRASLVNNVLDAVGIGLWAAGRFAAGVVPV